MTARASACPASKVRPATRAAAFRASGPRAISGPLTPVTSGLSRSLADTPPRRSGHVTGPDGTDSQADSAGCEDRAGGRRHAGGMACGLPRTRRRSVHGSSRVRGRGPGKAMTQSVPRCRPAAVMRIRDVAPGFGHDQGHVTYVQPCREASRLAGPDTVPHDSHGRAGWGRELQISRLFCKPICKPDAARQRETEPTRRDVICPIRRGHWTRERQPETAETHVVWLIAQRSRVQIPPPLPRPEALSRTEKRPFACGLCTDSRPGARRSLKPRPRSFRHPSRPARCGRTAQQGRCGLSVAVGRCNQASQMSSSSTCFSPSASATSALSLSSYSS